MNKIDKSDFNVDLLTTILIVNIILKYFHLISWSWALVLWPLWISIVIVIIVVIRGIFIYYKKRKKYRDL